MAERGIIFSGPMLRALLSGLKTQTRRPIKGVPRFSREYERRWHAHASQPGGASPRHWTWWEGPSHGPSLYHQTRLSWAVGDRLWVKETLRRIDDVWCYAVDSTPVPWPGRADIAGLPRETISPMLMRRSCSRLWLDVTALKVDRLDEITDVEALTEGVWNTAASDGRVSWTQSPLGGFVNSPRAAFMRLWDEIHGEGSWAEDPWVAVLAFTIEHVPMPRFVEAAHA